MSWNLESIYSCLNFGHISSKDTIDALVVEYARIIWNNHQKTGEHPEHFYSLEDDLPSGEHECIRVIAQELWKYIDNAEFGDKGTSLVVNYEYDSEKNDSDLAESLTKFLFSKSGMTHFLMRSAAFDKCGGYSHQWIGYWSNGEVVLDHTDEYFDRIFQQEEPARLVAS